MSTKLYSLAGFKGPIVKLDSSPSIDLKDIKATFDTQASFEISDENGDALKVFWTRTLTCILAPILVTAYYIVLWSYWIHRYDADGPVPQGPSGARWAYYTW